MNLVSFVIRILNGPILDSTKGFTPFTKLLRASPVVTYGNYYKYSSDDMFFSIFTYVSKVEKNTNISHCHIR